MLRASVAVAGGGPACCSHEWKKLIRRTTRSALEAAAASSAEPQAQVLLATAAARLLPPVELFQNPMRLLPGCGALTGGDCDLRRWRARAVWSASAGYLKSQDSN